MPTCPCGYTSDHDLVPTCGSCGADNTGRIPGWYPYRLTLTPEELRSAEYMGARGYLGDLVECATARYTDDEGHTILLYRESDWWPVAEAEQENQHEFWALTDRGTTLGAKVGVLLDATV